MLSVVMLSVVASATVLLIQFSACAMQQWTDLIKIGCKEIILAICLSRVIFTILHFLCHLRMGSVSSSICPWQAFTAWCNSTLQLIGPIHKLQRKWIVLNRPIFRVLFHTWDKHYIIILLCNFQMCWISLRGCPWQAFPALFVSKVGVNYWA